MCAGHATRLAAAFLVGLVAAVVLTAPAAGSGVNCSDFANQAAAQAFFLAHGGPAQDPERLDADHDGVACESLPCPCSSSTTPTAPATTTSSAPPTLTGCTKPATVQLIPFSKSKYPHIYKHYRRAVAKGWPWILTLNRPGAAARREKLLEDVPTRHGYDRDEYPPAEARGKGFHVRGINPRGWEADVMLVPSRENRSQGAVMKDELKPFCNGTRFRYQWQ